ncbi:hypothetical protein EDB87DRAFT_1230926 [Lactarius vividus]|nr:hypothetical protein EDB87DRAFT_1230926 [Lactarius vividus]
MEVKDFWRFWAGSGRNGACTRMAIVDGANDAEVLNGLLGVLDAHEFVFGSGRGRPMPWDVCDFSLKSPVTLRPTEFPLRTALLLPEYGNQLPVPALAGRSTKLYRNWRRMTRCIRAQVRLLLASRRGRLLVLVVRVGDDYFNFILYVYAQLRRYGYHSQWAHPSKSRCNPKYDHFAHSSMRGISG